MCLLYRKGWKGRERAYFDDGFAFSVGGNGGDWEICYVARERVAERVVGTILSRSRGETENVLIS